MLIQRYEIGINWPDNKNNDSNNNIKTQRNLV